MNIPGYSTMVVEILAEVDLLLNQYVFNGYAAVSSAMRALLGVISCIYIVLLGYGMMMGWIKLQGGEFVRIVLKIGLVYTAVTDWGMVSHYLIDGINGAVSQIGNGLMSASPIHIPGIGGVNGALQMVLIQFTQLGATVFNSGGITNFGGWVQGIVMWGFGYLMIAIGLFELILAKVMLAILFIFTPLIVVAAYFKPFHAIVDRWLGALVGFMFLQLFVTAALTLALSLAYWWTGAHVAETALQMGNYGSLPVIIIGIICIGLILKAADLAQNLGGVVSSSSGAAMIGGFMGSAMGWGLWSIRQASIDSLGGRAANTALKKAAPLVGKAVSQSALRVFRKKP